MKVQSVAFVGSLACAFFGMTAFVACSSSGSGTAPSADGGPSSSGGGNGSSSGTATGSSSGVATGSSSGVSGGSSGGGSSGGSSGGGSSSGSSSGGSGDGGTYGPPFAAGTICNASGAPVTPPATLKNIIVFLFENEDFSSVNGSAATAPYIHSLAAQCGTATAYNDDCFNSNLVSCPHYIALTSGSNCDTGLNDAGTGCILTDDDPTSSTMMTTASIFQQVSSWRAYNEDMGTACNRTSSGNYATKHNPAAYYSQLSSQCSANDISITGLNCPTSAAPMTSCGTPSNAFTDDLANDTLAAFTFVTPNLINDMHNDPPNTVTQGDNWLYTYMPLVFQSPAYLRGDVAVFILWDEQNSLEFDGPTPNVFISPYITAGTVSATPMNHFAVLRAWENALGISTYLGCASGTEPGTAIECPDGSTTDVRKELHW